MDILYMYLFIKFKFYNIFIYEKYIFNKRIILMEVGLFVGIEKLLNKLLSVVEFKV